MEKKVDHTSNEKRGIVKNPNNEAFAKDAANRLKQLTTTPPPPKKEK